MLNFLVSLICKPKDANDAMLLGKHYYEWWCEQRRVVDLPINPDKYANPFLTQDNIRELKKNDN